METRNKENAQSSDSKKVAPKINKQHDLLPNLNI
jgi:hypothetical protein